VKISDEKYREGDLICIGDALEYFGHTPEALLVQAENCNLQLYVALRPFTAKLIPHRVISDHTPLQAEYISNNSAAYVPLLPRYTGALKIFGEVEIQLYEAEGIPDAEVLYFWRLEESQKANISQIFIHSEHVEKIINPDAEQQFKQKSQMQAEAIRNCLITKGYDPLNLPKNSNGKPGVKSEIKKALLPNNKPTDLFTDRSFERAWECLLADTKRI